MNISMLPIFEEQEEVPEEEPESKLSIFRTIAPTTELGMGVGIYTNPNFMLHGLKGSTLQPSLLSGKS